MHHLGIELATSSTCSLPERTFWTEIAHEPKPNTEEPSHLKTGFLWAFRTRYTLTWIQFLSHFCLVRFLRLLKFSWWSAEDGTSRIKSAPAKEKAFEGKTSLKYIRKKWEKIIGNYQEMYVNHKFGIRKKNQSLSIRIMKMRSVNECVASRWPTL